MASKTAFQLIPGTILRRGLFHFYNHPALRRHGPLVLRRLGLYGVARTVYRWVFVAAGGPGARRRPLSAADAALTPRTRRILSALRAAGERSREARTG